ncbi:MAG: hypothetical protein ACRETT_09595 [Steroidobacteraceae bacterium]
MRTFPCNRVPRVATWALLAALVACTAGSDEMAWARAALERNDQLEIVAADEKARTFTVRVRETGQLKVVGVDEISAAPATASTVTTAAPPSVDAPPMASAAEPSATSGELASSQPAETPTEVREPPANVGGGRLIASGPGYSIKAGEGGAATESTTAEVSGAAVERRSEPLVCQGSRFMRIDGRNIVFDGDAVKAEEGCELYITNSRITASGVGLAARGASVHIKNSTVAGKSGAIHASGNAQIYAQSSRFRGMRRLDDAVLHDMGDNVWN